MSQQPKMQDLGLQTARNRRSVVQDPKWSPNQGLGKPKMHDLVSQPHRLTVNSDHPKPRGSGTPKPITTQVPQPPKLTVDGDNPKPRHSDTPNPTTQVPQPPNPSPRLTLDADHPKPRHSGTPNPSPPN